MTLADGPGLDVTVNAEGFDEAPTGLLERAVRVTLTEEAVTDAEVSLTLLDDVRITDLNRQYLGRDAPTDVLAFTLEASGSLLGDVYLGHTQAERQAEALDVPLVEELVRLAVHGTLHLVGHDHPEGPERVDSPMFMRQEALVRAVLAEADTA